MIRTTTILLLFPLLCFCQCSAISDDAVIVVNNSTINSFYHYILIGDSNSQGVNGTAGWSSNYITEQVDSYTYCNGTTVLYPPMPACNLNPHGVGIETSLNPTYVSNCENEIVVFKKGFGGSTVGGSGNNTWSINRNNRLSQFKKEYISFVMQSNSSCLSSIPVPKFIVLIAGFNDANNLALAQNYAVNEAELIEDLRKFYNSNLTVYTVTIPVESSLPYLAQVNGAKSTNQLTIDNYILLNLNGYPLNSDGVHISSSGLEQLGELIAGMQGCN